MCNLSWTPYSTCTTLIKNSVKDDNDDDDDGDNNNNDDDTTQYEPYLLLFVHAELLPL